MNPIAKSSLVILVLLLAIGAAVALQFFGYWLVGQTSIPQNGNAAQLIVIPFILAGTLVLGFGGFIIKEILKME